jgi:hypothetical protein
LLAEHPPIYNLGVELILINLIKEGVKSVLPKVQRNLGSRLPALVAAKTGGLTIHH